MCHLKGYTPIVHDKVNNKAGKLLTDLIMTILRMLVINKCSLYRKYVLLWVFCLMFLVFCHSPYVLHVVILSYVLYSSQTTNPMKYQESINIRIRGEL